MPIDSQAFRDAMRHFPAGVTVVTVKIPDGRRGMTVSAFASVSPSPPLIAVILDSAHSLHPLLDQGVAESFAVNILAEGQAEISNRFAFVKDQDRFAAGNWGEAETGAPVLAEALAWLDCRLYDKMRAGTHTIFVGEVVASNVPRPENRPLVYWNRDYRRIE
jgi:flavin reductase (DIM6/NTAB) family NADH-FMN oxidoreductase RutF